MLRGEEMDCGVFVVGCGELRVGEVVVGVDVVMVK